MKPPIPHDETARLEALRRYQILDSDPEADFDDITALAAQLCETPMAVISFVDEHRQWFKSRICVGLSETEREIAFCAHALLEQDILIVPDTLEDPRFVDNPLVTGEPYQRFYAGAVLRTADGLAVGTLCVMDTKPRDLTDRQISGLKTLARQVVALLELRLGKIRLAEDLARQETNLADLVNTLPGVAYQCRNEPDWPMIFMGGQIEELTGYTAEEFLSNTVNLGHLIHPDDQEPVWNIVQEALDKKTTYLIEYRLTTKDSQIRHIWEQGLGLYDETGALIALQGFLLDVTSSTRADEALAENVAQSQAILEALPDLMFRLNREGVYLDMHAPSLVEADYPRELFIGQPLHKVLPRHVAKLAYQAIEQAFVTRQVQTVQYRITPNEYISILHHYEARINPISNDQVIVLVRDITEKALAELRVAKQNEALHTLNQFAHEITAELDLSKIMTKLCEGATVLLGATSAYYSSWDVATGTSTVLAEYFSPEASEQELVSDLGITYDVVKDLGTTPEWLFDLERAETHTIDSPEISDVERNHLARYGVQAVLYLPVIREGRALGLFEVYESREPRVFTDGEVDLIISLISQTAVAIEKAELLAQSQQELEERIQAQATISYQATILDQIADAVISTDMDFTVRSWNKAAEVLYGYTAVETLGHKVGDFIETQYLNYDSPAQVFQELLTKGTLSARALQRIANGRELIIDTTPVILRDEQNQPTGLAAVNRDVTEEVQNERERARILEVLENATDFIGLADPDGRVLFINRAGRELIGMSLTGDVTQETMFTVHPQQHEERLRGELIATAVAQGSWQGEFFVQHQDGREIPVSMALVAHYDDQKQVTGFSAVIRDITAEKQAEQLRRQRQKYSELSLQLTQSQTLQQEGLIPAWQEMTQMVAQAVGVGRVSIWLYDSEAQAIQLVDLYQAITNSHSNENDFRLTLHDAPAYFQALQSERILIIDDVQTHYSTQDLLPGYLNPLGITSMMDAFARAGDEIRAVVCFEHVGPPRVWSPAEQDFANALADLITLHIEADERRQLQEQIRNSLERRSRQVRLSTQIAQQIAASTELFELYQRVVELIKEQFGYYHVQLLQYNPAMDAVALIVGYGEIGEQMLQLGHSIPMGTGIIGTAAATAEPVLAPDVSQALDWTANLLLPETRSELAVPILFGDKVLGVLDVQSSTVGGLDEEDQLLLEGLCGQIGTAIESTGLRQDMEERLNELNNLQRLISREEWQSFRSSHTDITGYLFDRFSTKPIVPDKENGKLMPLTSDQHSRLITQPITVRGELIGTLGIQDTAVQPLTPEDQELLAAISIQIAEALENARLIEQTQKRALELETVAQVSTASSNILEVETLLQTVVDLTKTSFNLYHAHIYLLDEEDKELRLAAGAGEIGTIMVNEGWRIPLYQQRSVVARTARSREGIVVGDTKSDPDFLPNPLLPQTRAELAVPMIAGDRLLGILDLQADRANAFTNDDLRIHSTLATQIAIALQNANLYQEQRETAEKLREVDILKSEFLASMSHELRTPLNSIIGFADVLLEGIDGELNERMEEDVRLIRDGGQHLRALIGDILDMSKIEAGMMDLNYNLIDLDRIAQEVLATIRGLLTEKPVEARLVMAPELIIEADRVRLVQILLNLLSNAAKFTDKGTVTLTIEERGENMLFSVRDTGIGIRPEDVSQVFEQFRQIGGIENRKAGGTGLGMPITKKLVELHGGKIWIESIYDVGTTFFFTIPMTKPEKSNNEQKQGYYS